MTAAELAEKIAAQVERDDWVSLGGLIRNLGEDLHGRYSMEPIRNVVCFAGCSRLFLDAMSVLLKERPQRVFMMPMEPMVSFFDGCPTIGVPFARRIPSDGYKTLHQMCMGLRPRSAMEKDHLGREAIKIAESRTFLGIDIKEDETAAP